MYATENNTLVGMHPVKQNKFVQITNKTVMNADYTCNQQNNWYSKYVANSAQHRDQICVQSVYSKLLKFTHCLKKDEAAKYMTQCFVLFKGNNNGTIND